MELKYIVILISDIMFLEIELEISFSREDEGFWKYLRTENHSRIDGNNFRK